MFNLTPIFEEQKYKKIKIKQYLGRKFSYLSFENWNYKKIYFNQQNDNYIREIEIL